MEQEKIKRDYEMFGRLWKFYKKYSGNPCDDDAYWIAATNEAGEIDKKYGSRMCRDILICIVSELDFLARHPAQPRPMGKPLPGKQFCGQEPLTTVPGRKCY